MKNAPEIDDDTLQRFYDGDLSPLEEHSVQQRIEGDPLAQRRLAELGQITELLRESAMTLGDSVHSSGLFAAIEARLAEPDDTRFGARFKMMTSEWVEHRRAALVPFVAATAVAAVTLFAVVKPGEPSLISVSSEAPGSEASSSAPEPAQLAATAPVQVHGSRVEDVDFGSSTGTVFEIDNQGVAVAVVWISDDEEAQ
ncbi:MAG: hypothetical protein JWN48_4496 [Myxococcaceae bacterium]|nr:hypothetical protein [Myxococcaceae bacterium]